MLSNAVARARARAHAYLVKPIAGFDPSAGNPFPAGAHPLDWRRSGLSRFGRVICRSFTEALLADEDDRGTLVGLDDATLDRVIHKFDLWIGSTSPDLGRAFFALCLALEASPTLTIRRARRFTTLGLADRVRVLEALENHENGLFSMLLTAFKVPLATAAFEEGALLSSTGFPRSDLIAARTLVPAARAAEATR